MTPGCGAVVETDVDELRRHLEVAEEEQEDEEVVDREAVLHEVRREEVEGRLAAFEGEDAAVEDQGRRLWYGRGAEGPWPCVGTEMRRGQGRRRWMLGG